MHSSGLDIENPDALVAYLVRTGRVSADERVTSRILPGGVSSRTVLLQRPGGESWVLKQALPKLRVKMDWFSDPQRVHREALALRCLEQLVPGRVPALLFEDYEEHLFAMSAVPQPHENWKACLLAGDIQADCVAQFAQMLIDLHVRAWQRRGEFSEPFADWRYFESLRLEPYYQVAASRVPAAAGFLERLIADTRQRRITLVHGDYSPKNILVRQGRLILLDHEVMHFGDPAFDLGFALTHLLSKAHHLERWRGELAGAAEQFWRIYQAGLRAVPWGPDLQQHSVRHTLGCLLARVAGRSPLEYLTAAQQARQQQAVVELLSDLPETMAELITGFLARV